ncbi:MAG: S9 family peptidase, partial [Pyrinomonadaceae bacterium]
YDVSVNGQMLAFTTDTTGFREYALQIKDLTTGKLLPERVERVSSIAWANDNKTLFYVVDDVQTKRPFKLYRHTVGVAAKDELVYEEKDEMFNLYVSRTRSRAFIIATSASHTTSEVRIIPTDKLAEAPHVIVPREAMHEYYVDHHSDRFYIRTNEGGAKNFKLVTAPVNDPARKNWKELMPHSKDVMIEDIDLFKNHLVVTVREKGLPELRITDLRDNKTHDLEFPEPAYTAALNVNKEFDSTTLRFSYQSLVTPASIYDYDMRTRERQLVKQTPVLGGYDPAQYKSERVHAVASDGTRIPISLVYKKDLQRDGKRPMLLQAYGSYGYPHPVAFTSARLSLLERGVVYAIAHIRGGGEMGKEWHDQGKMMNKKNTFTDFIASAEYLVNEKYTSKDRLVITGGSAGGLLMGAVTNMRPDLFKAVVSHVPFVDVINTMLDETLPLTVGEFQEWGNPKDKAAYDYMKSYSPYDQIAAKDYPAILVKTSLNDSQVMYWEPAKYVARLRAAKTDKNPLLLKTNMGAGHGGASGRYDYLREIAFDYAFILGQLGATQ